MGSDRPALSRRVAAGYSGRMRAALIAVLLLLAPEAHAQEPAGPPAIVPSPMPAPACPCEETWQDARDGGSKRLAAGISLAGAGAAGLTASLALLFHDVRESQRSGGTWTSLEMEFDMLWMAPAMASASALAVGVILASIGGGMRIESGRIASRMDISKLCFPPWRALHEFGRRHALVGSVFLVSGLELFAIGLGTHLITRANPEPEYSTWGPGMLSVVLGAVSVTAGIVLALRGRAYMRAALKMKEGESVSPPSPLQWAVTPAGVALTW